MNFFLFCLYSIAFRWFVFEYKRMEWLRVGIAKLVPLGTELLSCVYCQTIEASAIVFLALWLAGIIPATAEIPFAILANGWVALLVEPVVEEAIDRVERLHELRLTERS